MYYYTVTVKINKNPENIDISAFDDDFIRDITLAEDNVYEIEVDAEEFNEAYRRVKDFLTKVGVGFEAEKIDGVSDEEVWLKDDEYPLKNYFLTKDDILWALENRVMVIGFNEDKEIVCKCAGNWFYFDYDAEEYRTVKKYLADTTLDTVVKRIYETLEDLLYEDSTEYNLYMYSVKEAIHDKEMHDKEASDNDYRNIDDYDLTYYTHEGGIPSMWGMLADKGEIGELLCLYANDFIDEDEIKDLMLEGETRDEFFDRLKNEIDENVKTSEGTQKYIDYMMVGCDESEEKDFILKVLEEHKNEMLNKEKLNRNDDER